MSNPLQLLKAKIQAQKDELDQMKDELEVKSKEVDDEKVIRSAVELEIATASRRIKLMEQEYDVAQKRLEDAEEKLNSIIQSAEQSESFRKVFESQMSVNDDRSVNLEQSVKECRELANNAEIKLNEASRKLQMQLIELDRAEERATEAERKMAGLEDELDRFINLLKCKQKNEGETNEREEAYETTINELTAQLKSVENKTFEDERSSIKLEREIKRLEGELNHTLEIKESIQREMDAYFNEVQAF